MSLRKILNCVYFCGYAGVFLGIGYEAYNLHEGYEIRESPAFVLETGLRETLAHLNSRGIDENTLDTRLKSHYTILTEELRLLESDPEVKEIKRVLKQKRAKNEDIASDWLLPLMGILAISTLDTSLWFIKFIRKAHKENKKWAEEYVSKNKEVNEKS